MSFYCDYINFSFENFKSELPVALSSENADNLEFRKNFADVLIKNAPKKLC